MLSTAFALISLLAAAASAVFAYLARRDTLEALDARKSVQGVRATLGAMSDRINAVEGRLDRLAGRVYAQARKPRVDEQVTADLMDELRDQSAAADPELAELLRLQSAPAVMPGKPNGR